MPTQPPNKISKYKCAKPTQPPNRIAMYECAKGCPSPGDFRQKLEPRKSLTQTQNETQKQNDQKPPRMLKKFIRPKYLMYKG